MHVIEAVHFGCTWDLLQPMFVVGKFLRAELMPAVRARFPTDGHDALIGESLADLFVAATSSKRLTLFDDYIALSPSLGWNGRAVVGRWECACVVRRELRLLHNVNTPEDYQRALDELPPPMSVITAPAEHRQRCYRCWRPVATCFCSELPTLPTRTRIVIVQHPHERCHPFGTARLVGLCLPRSRIHVAYKGLSGDLNCPVDVPRDAAVLFPHASASDLADLPATERPSTLVVLDGTWAHSKRLYRENPWLQRLRHVRLRPPEPSRYRIRREPQADYVSTVEAVVQALRILEPATSGLDGLLAAFDRMIDRQVEIVAQVERHGRSKSERLRPSRALSPLLLDPRLVVAYAETSLPGGVPTATRELVQWVAARVRTGEVFEALLRPAGEWPSPHHLAHMQLEPETLAGGETQANASERFAAFAGPDAPVAAWTQSTLDWGSSVIGARPRTVLKTSYCNLRNHRASYLETVLQREQLAGVENQCHGRARERLGNALAVARWLRDVAANVDQGNRAPGAG